MSLHKCKWAHKLIWNDDNTLAEKHARLVGCGYSQVQGRDYTASYLGTPKATTVRMFEASIACHDLEEEHFDGCGESFHAKQGIRLRSIQP